MQTLKLDSSYKPIGIVDSVDAFSLLWRGKAIAIENYETELHSGNDSWPEPAVVVLYRFVDYKFFQIGCTRRNIYERDRYVCQYCKQRFAGSKLTLDHVIPKSKGGGKSWDNLVTSCMKCNQKKGNKMPSEIGMHPFVFPVKPRYKLLDYLGPNIPKIWIPYLKNVYTW